MRIAIIGGSNSLIGGGFGRQLEALLKRQGNHVANLSIGASPSLRGLSLVSSQGFDAGKWDRIVFEYTLNDLIYEANGLISPIWHRKWMGALAALNARRGNILPVMMCNRHSLGRVRAGDSLIYENYRRLLNEQRIIGLDALPFLDEEEKRRGSADTLYRDNDHLADDVAAKLAEKCAELLVSPPAPANRQELPAGTTRLLADYQKTDGEAATKQTFSTSVIDTSVTRLNAGEELTLTSPGGHLAGFHVTGGNRAGPLLIETPTKRVVKNLQDHFSLIHGKELYYLRHLNTPIQTERGDIIRLRLVENWFIPDADYDRTHTEVPPRAPFAERYVRLGPAVFFREADA